MSLVNSFLRAEMEAEVRRRMAQGASFTALEISRAVQQTGVRALFECGGMPGYDRRTIALPCGGRPFLYFPCGAAPRVGGFATARTRQTSLRIRRPDAWNRLRLPAKALRDAGLAPGATAWVRWDAPRGVVVVGSDPTSGDRLYRIDRYGNLRLALGRGVRATAFALTAQPGRLTAQGQ
jgi:hypothetical protein